MLVEAGIMIGLAVILSYIKIYRAPIGGFVTTSSMIPILLFAIRWRVAPRVFAGGTYGI